MDCICDIIMIILIDFNNFSDGLSAATPLHSERDRGSDGIDQENVHPRKTSNHSETSAVDINQPSTSISVEDSPVHCPKPGRTEQSIDVGNDVINVPSSDIIENAVQPGEILFFSWYMISVGFT